MSKPRVTFTEDMEDDYLLAKPKDKILILLNHVIRCIVSCVSCGMIDDPENCITIKAMLIGEVTYRDDYLMDVTRANINMFLDLYVKKHGECALYGDIPVKDIREMYNNFKTIKELEDIVNHFDIFVTDFAFKAKAIQLLSQPSE